MELDIYENIDLCICEYEDTDIDKVDSLPLEDWFIKEVTDDKSYKNSHLAYSYSFKCFKEKEDKKN